jgi:hypothetical protein
MSDAIVNKVSESGLITLDLEQYYPREEVVLFDLKDYLFMGLILKEKDFREALKNQDWEVYRKKYVGVTCSADAIIPPWAYMLAASYLQPVAKDVIMGDEKEVHKTIFLQNIQRIDINEFTGQRVVVRAVEKHRSGNLLTWKLQNASGPFCKTIMYGEPCSTVPIYKKPPSPKGE